VQYWRDGLDHGKQTLVASVTLAKLDQPYIDLCFAVFAATLQ